MWALEWGLSERVHASPELPSFGSSESSAAIVVNAARDHARAIEWALSAGVPVLVEKPVTLTGAESQRLADLARQRSVHFASAHIFLFAGYIDRFSALVADAGRVRAIRVRWTDPQSENRYGEQKQYDPGLPIFMDWLPHVMSIVGTLTSDEPEKCEIAKLLRGGAHLELTLMLGDIPCSIQLIRNSDQRRRIVEVDVRHDSLRLDFSREPGTVTCGGATMSGDPDWGGKARPSSQMLSGFLKWAAGGDFDARLDIETGLQACRLIDVVAARYYAILMPWLIDRLSSPGPIDEDVRYALCEILQYERSYPRDELELQIERIRDRLLGASHTQLMRELAMVSDSAKQLRIIACGTTNSGLRKNGQC